MTVFYSTAIANQLATPPTINDAKQVNGINHCVPITWEATDNANGDSVVICKVPVDGVPTSLRFGSDALSAGTVDLGLYYLATDGVTFTAVDQDCFASAIAVTSASAMTEVLFEAAATNIAFLGKTFWQWAQAAAGTTTRPNYSDLYLVATYATGTGAAGTNSIILEYNGS